MLECNGIQKCGFKNIQKIVSASVRNGDEPETTEKKEGIVMSRLDVRWSYWLVQADA